jgi:hypothetical protein
VPAGKLRDDLRAAAPLVLVYDPSGKSVERLEGSRGTSLSRVSGAIEKQWTACFEMKLRDFIRKMDGILDKLEKIETKLIAVEIKRRRAGGSSSRLAACDREEKKLEGQEKELLADQSELIAGVKLRDGYVSATSD